MTSNYGSVFGEAIADYARQEGETWVTHDIAEHAGKRLNLAPADLRAAISAARDLMCPRLPRPLTDAEISRREQRYALQERAAHIVAHQDIQLMIDAAGADGDYVSTGAIDQTRALAAQSDLTAAGYRAELAPALGQPHLRYVRVATQPTVDV